MTAEQYEYLNKNFSDCGGDGSLHPDVARDEYGFPELTTPALQIHVIKAPEGAKKAWTFDPGLMIWQAKQYKNGHRAWIRLKSYAEVID